MVVIVMGVSGSGKSTVGRLLADRLEWDFVEADELHSADAVAKMRSGEPLTDDDRRPWIERLASELARYREDGRSVVLACSALRRAHRQRLSRAADAVRFVHLVAPPELLRERLGARRGHFMPPSLLDDQLATLETPEDALVLDASRPARELALEAEQALTASGRDAGGTS